MNCLKKGYAAVCVTVGLWKPIELGIENEDLALKMADLLSKPSAYKLDGRVAVIGGGATAIDCAITAKKCGAKHVELFMLEKLSEMPLTAKERKEILDFDIESERTHPDQQDYQGLARKSPALKR